MKRKNSVLSSIIIAVWLTLTGCSAYIDVMIVEEHDDEFYVVGMAQNYGELIKKKKFPEHSSEGDKVKVKISRAKLKNLLADY